MKTLFAIIALTTFLCFSAPEHAQSQNRSGSTGIGFILGQPTGISIAHWTVDTRSFALGAAWHFSSHSSFLLHTDYLFHRFEFLTPEKGFMSLYYGIGGRIHISGREAIGVRLPVGISYHFEQAPFELFFEIVPIFDIVPGTEFSGNSGLGARFYF